MFAAAPPRVTARLYETIIYYRRNRSRNAKKSIPDTFLADEVNSTGQVIADGIATGNERVRRIRVQRTDYNRIGDVSEKAMTGEVPVPETSLVSSYRNDGRYPTTDKNVIK